jgi:predicted metal-dependent HD superfamily phosphohydrolase
MRPPSTPLSLVTGALQGRFTKLAQSLGAETSLIETWSSAFIARYTEPQRHYHTLNHVAAMLDCLDKHRDKLSEPLAVELAIIFHDWIYEPQAKENEAESVVEFETYARQIGLDEGLRARVARFIDATKMHQICTDVSYDEKIDLSFFLDFDLEVLGRNWEDYLTYAKQIRQEYSYFNDEEFCSGRVKVLRNFSARERLFFSEEFFKTSEEAARENIRREIELLETSAGA